MSANGPLFEALATAVEPKNCSAEGCLTNPITKRDGEPVCAYHRDVHDHKTFGKYCERCESREWIETPHAESVAVCLHCDLAVYDEEILRESW